MYKLSRYWNKLACSIIVLGQKMIWDYTNKNTDILKDAEEANSYVKYILT